MPSRRGSVVIIVLWTIAIAAIIVSSIQLFAYRQATVGRESLERVQARWAARAGLENTIAAMARLTEKPDPTDAKALIREMHAVSGWELLGARYDILHHVEGRNLGVPADEHSKLNLNRTNDAGLLLAFDDFTLDVLDAIGDWMDEDDEPRVLGVERDYYLSLDGYYEPRNGLLRTIGEVELIAGIWPRHFRGEDWNLNGRLDPNENDGARSFPPDEPDGILDAGWSDRLTVYSVANGATESGQPRLWLRNADPKDVMERVGVTAVQADALIQYGKNEQNDLTNLIFNPLPIANTGQTGTGQGGQAGQGGQGGRGGQQGGQNQNQGQQTQGEQLTDDQLQKVLAELSVANPKDRLPGKMNLNTVSAEFLRDIFELLQLDEAVADEIVYRRESPTGIASLLDLRKIPGITTQDLQQICSRFDVVSNVFTVSSRGMSAVNGVEVEIVAVVDRSTIPVRILEYREQ